MKSPRDGLETVGLTNCTAELAGIRPAKNIRVSCHIAVLRGRLDVCADDVLFKLVHILAGLEPLSIAR